MHFITEKGTRTTDPEMISQNKKRLETAVRKVEFVNEQMIYLILQG
jgi:tetrahydromethanopterin S-methyltransferase subunit G